MCFAFIQVAWAGKPVELRTSLWPPYQVMLKGELSGVAMTAVKCIFEGLDEGVNVKVMPWGRAISDMKSRQADGLFTSIYSEELSSNAVMSSPFALEKWYVYSMGNVGSLAEGLPLDTRFAAVRSSSQFQWLRSNGFNNIEEVNEGGQLLLLLASGRIDAFIADDRYYNELEKVHYAAFRGSLPTFNRRFLRYTPLGVYFTNEFVDEYPSFMEKFNNQITECAGTPITLSALEEKTIRRIFERRLRPLLSNREVFRALTQQNRMSAGLAPSVKNKLDETWRRERAGEDQPFIDDLLARQVSVMFKAIQDTSDGLFTEIFLVDRYGLNTAQSVVTTDYDQSDEQAYAETIAKTSEQLFISAIQFDASSMKFHVQVSVAIKGEADRYVGMLTVGIDVEEALRQGAGY